MVSGMSARRRASTTAAEAGAKPAARLGDVLAAGLRERPPRPTAPTDECSAYNSEIADVIRPLAWVPCGVLVYAQFANGDAHTFVCAENTLLDPYKTRQFMNAGFMDTAPQDLNAFSEPVQMAIAKIPDLQRGGWGLTGYNPLTGFGYRKPQSSGINPPDMVLLRVGKAVGGAEPPRIGSDCGAVNVAEFKPEEFTTIRDYFIHLLKGLLPGAPGGKCDQQLFYMLGSRFPNGFIIDRQPDARCDSQGVIGTVGVPYSGARTVEQNFIDAMAMELQPLLDVAPERSPPTRVAFGFFM